MPKKNFCYKIISILAFAQLFFVFKFFIIKTKNGRIVCVRAAFLALTFIDAARVGADFYASEEAVAAARARVTIAEWIVFAADTLVTRNAGNKRATAKKRQCEADENDDGGAQHQRPRARTNKCGQQSRKRLLTQVDGRCNARGMQLLFFFLLLARSLVAALSERECRRRCRSRRRLFALSAESCVSPTSHKSSA